MYEILTWLMLCVVMIYGLNWLLNRIIAEKERRKYLSDKWYQYEAETLKYNFDEFMR
jgi:hypothetical protein